MLNSMPKNRGLLMSKTVVLILLLAVFSFAAKKDSLYYDHKLIELKDIKALFDDGEYNEVVHDIARNLSDPRISFNAMEQMNKIRIDAFSEMHQYSMVNKLYKSFIEEFYESQFLLHLTRLNMDAFARRRLYYEAVVSCNDAINYSRETAPDIYQELQVTGREYILDELTKDEAEKIWGHVDEELRVILKERYLAEGIPVPKERARIVKEVWNERVRKNQFRGSALVGANIPIQLNEDISIGMNLQFTGLYRIWNGFAPGLHVEANIWRHKVENEAIIPGEGEEADVSSGSVALAVPIMVVPRVYAPQINLVKIFFEPGGGIAIFNEDLKNEDTKVVPAVMADIGVTFNDMVEFRPGARFLFDDGEMKSWLSVSLGLVIKGK